MFLPRPTSLEILMCFIQHIGTHQYCPSNCWLLNLEHASSSTHQDPHLRHIQTGFDLPGGSGGSNPLASFFDPLTSSLCPTPGGVGLTPSNSLPTVIER